MFNEKKDSGISDVQTKGFSVISLNSSVLKKGGNKNQPS
jgi:hypothetical protein